VVLVLISGAQCQVVGRLLELTPSLQPIFGDRQATDALAIVGIAQCQVVRSLLDLVLFRQQTSMDRQATGALPMVVVSAAQWQVATLLLKVVAC